jgi:hypothetical protein
MPLGIFHLGQGGSWDGYKRAFEEGAGADGKRNCDCSCSIRGCDVRERLQQRSGLEFGSIGGFFSARTYKVASKSQRANYVVTDRVVGSEYVPALKITGLVVEEFYNLDRAGLRPIVYLAKDGYLTRLSGLDYVEHQIKAPAWGRSEEARFLPARLLPNLSWHDTLFPYGKLPGSFDITESHKSFVEASDVVVPAGHFKGCIRIETYAHYEGGAYAQQKQNLSLTYEDWYAPNVGLVRTVAYQGGANGPEMERVELMRFESAPKPAPKEPQPPAPPQAAPPSSQS